MSRMSSRGERGCFDTPETPPPRLSRKLSPSCARDGSVADGQTSGAATRSFRSSGSRGPVAEDAAREEEKDGEGILENAALSK